MVSKERKGREAYWRAVLKRHAASGLSVRAFCRQERIRESAYYFWRRTIHERDEAGKSTSEGPAFVPAVVSDRSDRDAAIAIELASGQVLRLPVTISASWLAELIDALGTRGER